MPNPLSEHEREALADLLDSPGWHILWGRLMPHALDACHASVINNVRVESFTQAARFVGKFEGAVQVALEAYQASNIQPPDYIRAYQKGAVTDGRPNRNARTATEPAPWRPAPEPSGRPTDE